MTWTLRRVPKNNGLMSRRPVHRQRQCRHVAPAIYLNPCYDQHRKPDMPLDQIVAELHDPVSARTIRRLPWIMRCCPCL
ncbi:MAG: hypothetical protein ACLTW9_18115 [Enterocloster sp.]